MKDDAFGQDLESFRRWVAVAVAMPSARKDLRARVAHHAPEDLSAMIEVLREAELVCLARFGAFNRRTRDERRDDGHGAKQRVSIQEYAESAERWYEGVKWLQDARLHLGRGKSAGGLGDHGRAEDGHGLEVPIELSGVRAGEQAHAVVDSS